MKSLMHLLAVVLFTAAVGLTSSASTLLCQTGPVTLAGKGTTFETIYSCAIPAKAVATGKSIRVTALVFGDGSAIASQVFMNGHSVLGAEPNSTLAYSFYQFIIVNTGATTGSLTGLVPGSSPNTTQPFGMQSVSPATLPWASGWTLEVSVATNAGFNTFGTSFTVELLD
jgi:hypothetical protein